MEDTGAELDPTELIVEGVDDDEKAELDGETDETAREDETPGTTELDD